MSPRPSWLFWLSIFLLLCRPCSGPAQEPGRGAVGIDQAAWQVDRLPWMTVLVTVTDQQDQVWKGLAENNFLIEEDGVVNPVRPTVQAFVAADRGLDYAILIDHRDDAPTSLTMIGRAVEEFVNRMGFRYSGAMVSYTDQPRVVAGPARDPDLLASAALALDPVSGSPQPVQGLLLGVKTLNESTPASVPKLFRKVIIFLTDGTGGNEPFAPTAAGTRLLESGVELFTVSYGSADNPALAEWAELSRASGGAYFFAAHPDQLPPCLAALAERLKYQYVLTFPAARIKPDGRIHRLKVLVEAPGFKGEGRFEFVSPALPEAESWPWPGPAALAMGLAVLFWLVRRGGLKKARRKKSGIRPS